MPYAMKRAQERLAGTFEVVGNTVARNSRNFDGRPPCCGNEQLPAHLPD